MQAEKQHYIRFFNRRHIVINTEFFSCLDFLTETNFKYSKKRIVFHSLKKCRRLLMIPFCRKVLCDTNLMTDAVTVFRDIFTVFVSPVVNRTITPVICLYFLSFYLSKKSLKNLNAFFIRVWNACSFKYIAKI